MRKGVVIHHTGVARHYGMRAVDIAEEVDAAHRAMGWAGIGYHFVINRYGSEVAGRPLASRTSSHCLGYNRSHIGISFGGNYEHDVFATASRFALDRLLQELRDDHGVGLEVIPHCRARGASTLCPGKNILAALSDLWTDA